MRAADSRPGCFGGGLHERIFTFGPLRLRALAPILPGLTLFRLLLLSLCTVLNFGWAGTVLYLLRRRGVRARWLGPVVFGWAALMIALLAVQGYSPPAWRPVLREWFYFPLSVEMVWNLLFLHALGAIAATLLFGLARRVDRGRETMPQDLSRRRFLREARVA